MYFHVKLSTECPDSVEKTVRLILNSGSASELQGILILKTSCYLHFQDLKYLPLEVFFFLILLFLLSLLFSFTRYRLCLQAEIMNRDNIF